MPSTKPPGYKGHGRPGKLTPELQKKICEYIAAGNYLVTACQAVGIDKATYLHWLERAEAESENGGGHYRDFLIAVKEAEAKQEAAIVDRLIDASGPGMRKRVTRTDAEGNISVEEVETGGEWLAAATYLERRHPERYGRKDRSSITIDEHKRVTITYVEVVKDYGQGAQVIEGESREVPEKLTQGED